MILDDVPSAELAVLGAVIATGGTVLDDLHLQPVDFDNPAHGDLYELMQSMWGRGITVDTVTLASANPTHAAFLYSLTDHTPFVSAVHHYADIVASHGMYRRIVSAADALRGLSPELGSEALFEAATDIVSATQGGLRARVRFIRDILPDVVARLESRQTFVPTPWRALNEVIGGLRPGAVYVIAARPGIGKTVIAAQLAARLAEEGTVAFSSLEMSEDELVTRMISERLSIPVGALKDNRLTPDQWQAFAKGRPAMQALNIAIDDRAASGPADIRAHAKAVSREGKLAGVVVDYLQLMSSTGKQDRHVQVAEFSRQMKILAKDFKVPVIAVSQLNRKSEERTDPRPFLSDLRESGAIEQDADVVILLHKERGDDADDKIILNVAKNRHGLTKEVQLRWSGMYSRAVNW